MENVKKIMNKIQANNQKLLPKHIFDFVAQDGNESMRKGCTKLAIWLKYLDIPILGGFYIDTPEKQRVVIDITAGKEEFQVNSFGDIFYLSQPLNTRADLRKALLMKDKTKLPREWQPRI